MGLLDAENAFYEEHREKLQRQHPNRYVLIHGKELQGAYDTEEVAIDVGYRLFGAGPFLVRRTGEDALVISNPALTLGVPLAVVRSRS